MELSKQGRQLGLVRCQEGLQPLAVGVQRAGLVQRPQRHHWHRVVEKEPAARRECVGWLVGW